MQTILYPFCIYWVFKCFLNAKNKWYIFYIIKIIIKIKLYFYSIKLKLLIKFFKLKLFKLTYKL